MRVVSPFVSLSIAISCAFFFFFFSPGFFLFLGADFSKSLGNSGERQQKHGRLAANKLL
jgi:hypothetical protein